MTNRREDPNKIHTVQAERDLEANWDVDLAKKLEDYLLKICSGEITGAEADNSHFSVNFAEAALLLQGSVQVYSRKVEYLYNLVLHALDFLSQKRQQEELESTSAQQEQGGTSAVHDEEQDQFWDLDDIPVEPRNCLDASTSKDASFYHFVKPPANLVVLEGDCLDSTGDAGELESYLLATNDLYQDFILLDPCDAAAVNDFLKVDEAGKKLDSTYKSNSNRKSFQSPQVRSGGTLRKSSLGKNQNANLNQASWPDCSFRDNEKLGNDPPAEDGNHGYDFDDGYSGPQDFGGSDGDGDDDDPWRPLNPHEPGNLKVKPFKKVRSSRRNELNPNKKRSTSTLFPLAKLHGTSSPELTEIWETQCNKFERPGDTQSPPLYEKLRWSLTNGGNNNSGAFGNVENDHEDNGFDSGFPDDEMPENIFMDEDLPHHEKHDDGGIGADYDTHEPSSQASLEDLCRSHLDALLANMAETEKQTELAARVSSWKQKIEHDLEEQESHPPFDIHAYGETILGKLLNEAEEEKVMSFADLVKGQAKHDVARSFSALLQLVNNRDIDLDKSGVNGDSLCYTSSNPFHVRLRSHGKRQQGSQFRLPKKKVKLSITKGGNKENVNKHRRDGSPKLNSSSEFMSTVTSPTNCKSSVKLGKTGNVRCTPEGKRRRRSQFVEPVDLNSAR